MKRSAKIKLKENKRQKHQKVKPKQKVQTAKSSMRHKPLS